MVLMQRFAAILMLAACALAQDPKPVTAQDEKPAPTIPELETTAQAAYMKGDYDGARESLLAAWTQAQQLPQADPIRYDVLKRLASVRATVGEYADADNYLQMAISWREQNQGLNDPKTVDDVLISVGYARGLKDYDRALLIMNRVIRLHTSANIAAGMSPKEAMSSVTVADDFSRIAQIQSEQQKVDDAITSLNMALDIRTRLAGPLDGSLIYDLDRLATLQVTKRVYDQAEATYRHAL